MSSYTGELKETIYINGVALPQIGSIKEITTPNLSKNVTLDGTLQVDYVNNRRSWEITWNYLTAAQYDTIRALYDNQFLANNFTLPTLWIPSINLSVSVLIEIIDKNIKWNGKLIQDFSITLEEQYAVS